MNIWKILKKQIAFGMALVMLFGVMQLGIFPSMTVSAAPSADIVAGGDSSHKNTLIPVNFEDVNGDGSVYVWKTNLSIWNIGNQRFWLSILPKSFAPGSVTRGNNGGDTKGLAWANATDGDITPPVYILFDDFGGEKYIEMNGAKIPSSEWTAGDASAAGDEFTLYVEVNMDDEAVTLKVADAVTNELLYTLANVAFQTASTGYELTTADPPGLVALRNRNGGNNKIVLSKWSDSAEDWAPEITFPAAAALETMSVNDAADITFSAFASAFVATTYSVDSGTLPTGLTLSPAGKLTGTATAADTYNFSVAATSIYGTATKAYSMAVTAGSAPVVSTTSFPNGMVGANYSAQINANRSPISYAIDSGTLPDGLTLDTATGIISGKPTTVGTASFEVTATNDDGTSAPQALTIEILAQPSNELILDSGDSHLIELFGWEEDQYEPGIYVWQGLVTAVDVTGWNNLQFTIFPANYAGGAPVNSGTGAPVYIRMRDLDEGNGTKDFQNIGGGGATPGGSWEAGETYRVEIRITATGSVIRAYDSDDNLTASVSRAFNDGAFSATNPPRYLGLYQNGGQSKVEDYMPVFWPQPEPPVVVDPNEPYAEPDIDNGDYYINVVGTPAYQYVAYELFQPLRGDGTSSETNAPSNTLAFDLVVTDVHEGGNMQIAFNPNDRRISGGNSRAWGIQLAADGTYQVRDQGTFTPTGVNYSQDPNAPDRVEVVFDFTNYTYTVKVNGSPIATDQRYTGRPQAAHDPKIDGENVDYQTFPDNMGIISVLSVADGGQFGCFEMRNISAGITNIVDNDEIKTASAVNPTTNADGTKTYRVGPNEIFQKPQDVTYMLDAGDTVEIMGDATYPAPLHYLSGYDANDGTPGKPITFKGIIQNGKKPVIQSIASTNVVMIEASNIVLENLDISGHIDRAIAIRGFTTLDQLKTWGGDREHESFISYRGVYYSNGDNLVIRNCDVHGNYQGIHCASPGDLLVEYCDVYENGTNAYGHNLYLSSREGAVHTIRYNHIRDTLGNNNGLKSRAWRNDVYGNFFENCAQAIELLGPDPAFTGGGQYGEVINNIFVNCRQGMRLGGDGTGPGSSGRFRVMNNTYIASTGNTFIRAFMALDTIEIYNNVMYVENAMNFYEDQGANWVTGSEKVVGESNWVSAAVNSASVPATVTGTVTGAAGANPFVDLAGKDFRLADGSDAAAITPVAADTVHNWGANASHSDAAFINPMTDTSFLPLDLATWTVGTKEFDSVGAFGMEEETVAATPTPAPTATPSLPPGGGNSTAPTVKQPTPPAVEEEVVLDVIVKDEDGKVLTPGADGNIIVPEGGGTASIGNDVVVELPEGSVVDSNNAITVGDGGAVVTLPDATIEVDGGTEISQDNGNIVIDGNATVNVGENVEIGLPLGGSVSADGSSVTVGDGGAEIVYPSGITLQVDEGGVIMLDETAPLGFVVVTALPFTDVAASAWYYDAVMFVYSNNLFAGTGTDTFSPSMVMTRGMLVAVLHRMVGAPEMANLDSFADVAQAAYFAAGAAWAKEAGITSGTGGGMFSPNTDITREQLVTMLMRFAEHMGLDTTVTVTTEFADAAEISPWALDAVNWARANDIVSGKPGNTFDPKASATRAEAATVLKALIEMAK